MHPYKRRRVQPPTAEQAQFSARRMTADEYLGLEMRTPAVYNHAPHFPTSELNYLLSTPLRNGDDEEASLRLARQLQSQEEALVQSSNQPSSLSGPYSQAMPYMSGDSSVWQSQAHAQLVAENIQSLSAAKPMDCPYQLYPPAGFPFGENSATRANKPFAGQQVEELDELRAPGLRQTEPRIPPTNGSCQLELQENGIVDTVSTGNAGYQFAHSKCGSCGKRHFSKDSQLVTHFKRWINRQGKAHKLSRKHLCEMTADWIKPHQAHAWRAVNARL